MRITELEKVIRARDEISHDEFMELVGEAIAMHQDGDGVEEILYDVFGIEPDYFFDLLELIGEI